jgi:hypothetical protein
VTVFFLEFLPFVFKIKSLSSPKLDRSMIFSPIGSNENQTGLFAKHLALDGTTHQLFTFDILRLPILFSPDTVPLTHFILL